MSDFNNVSLINCNAPIIKSIINEVSLVEVRVGRTESICDTTFQ